MNRLKRSIVFLYVSMTCFLVSGQVVTGTQLLWESNSLVLKNPAGKIVAEYAGKLGKPDSWVDARPLKIMLFYKSYQRIEFLDHRLNRIGDAIFLPDVGIFQAQLACPSIQNGVWIYDQTEHKVHFVDFKLRKRTSTLDITLALSSGQFSVQEQPFSMKEEGNRLYLLYPQGTIVIDRYGNFVKVISTK